MTEARDDFQGTGRGNLLKHTASGLSPATPEAVMMASKRASETWERKKSSVLCSIDVLSPLGRRQERSKYARYILEKKILMCVHVYVCL